MRTFTLTTLTTLAALLIFARAASAQEAARAWVKLTPERESFVAEMPTQPSTRDVRIEAGKLKVSGRAYVSTGDGEATYTLLALDDPNKVGERLIAANNDYVSARFRGEGAYLDEIAEVAWEALVRPEYERLKAEQVTDFSPGMDYRREFELDGRPAREYRLKLRKASGPVYVCADGPRLYIVAAFSADAQLWHMTRFVTSFDPDASRPAPPAPPGAAGGAGLGDIAGGGEVDYTRVFNRREVTPKAAILTKPEPSFPEAARKFSVTGVVRIRAVLNRTGEVTDLVVIKGLPHGLTARAVDAARRIRFRPAQKDGRDVSQYVTFEYNFNIY